MKHRKLRIAWSVAWGVVAVSFPRRNETTDVRDWFYEPETWLYFRLCKVR